MISEWQEWQIELCCHAFTEFGKKYPQIKDPHVLEKLTNGIGPEDLTKALGTTAAEVIEVNSKVEPHVFYICPHNLTARLGSHFMKVHIDRIKEQSCKSSWWCIW